MTDNQTLLERAVKKKDTAAANELLALTAAQLEKMEQGIKTLRHLLLCLQSIYTLEPKTAAETKEGGTDGRI